MQLKRITLLNFKNILQAELNLEPGINALVGDNGAGKTNMLDAIYHLSMGKSLFAMSDAQSILHGADFYMIEGGYMSDSGREERISCAVSRQRGVVKKLKRNGKEYERLADHVGLIPLVAISPQDSSLISDSAEERRRFLNAFISQIDSTYLNSLIRYNALLQQRNRALKMGSEESMLLIYDEQIAPLAEAISSRRAELIETISPMVQRFYTALCRGGELISLEYRSELLSSDMLSLLLKSRQRDIVNQHTTVGIHRDELNLMIDGYPLRKYGSQGQQKSFLIALKLAQYQLIGQALGDRAILLLDDLF
ncbi:MAG: DNA replication and repair protein RecF, partial [Rikenellaceae bacterium]